MGSLVRMRRAVGLVVFACLAVVVVATPLAPEGEGATFGSLDPVPDLAEEARKEEARKEFATFKNRIHSQLDGEASLAKTMLKDVAKANQAEDKVAELNEKLNGELTATKDQGDDYNVRPGGDELASDYPDRVAGGDDAEGLPRPQVDDSDKQLDIDNRVRRYDPADINSDYKLPTNDPDDMGEEAGFDQQDDYTPQQNLANVMGDVDRTAEKYTQRADNIAGDLERQMSGTSASLKHFAEKHPEGVDSLDSGPGRELGEAPFSPNDTPGQWATLAATQLDTEKEELLTDEKYDKKTVKKEEAIAKADHSIIENLPNPKQPKYEQSSRGEVPDYQRHDGENADYKSKHAVVDTKKALHKLDDILADASGGVKLGENKEEDEPRWRQESRKEKGFEAEADPRPAESDTTTKVALGESKDASEEPKGFEAYKKKIDAEIAREEMSMNVVMNVDNDAETQAKKVKKLSGLLEKAVDIADSDPNNPAGLQHVDPTLLVHERELMESNSNPTHVSDKLHRWPDEAAKLTAPHELEATLSAASDQAMHDTKKTE